MMLMGWCRFLFLSLLFSLLTAELELISFISTRNGISEVAVVPADGSSEPRVLTDLQSEVSNPRLSHKSDKIVFSTNYQSEHHMLWVVDVEGAMKPHRLTQFPMEDGVEIAADWSPDDSMLVVELVSLESGFTHIYLIDFEGESKIPLMEDKGRYNDFFARWSPSGREILFLSDRVGHHPEFYIYDLENDFVQNLHYIPPIVHFPIENGPSYLVDGYSFVYQEESDAGFVNFAEVSLENQSVQMLFPVDIVHRPSTAELGDLGISQCVSSPWKKGLFCCRYLQGDKSGSVLALVREDGVVVKHLTTQEFGVSASSPSWK
mmetsp:Transcript_6362/g.8467  ORF Transcript_6362/g.8467 Transcript_6362/m.8467 type:complete len:319 (+) Transcript_6362:146-1102(+)